jgi:hypothetical protein
MQTLLPCALLPIEECDSEDDECAAAGLSSGDAADLAAAAQTQRRMLARDSDEEEDPHGVGIDALPTTRCQAAASAAHERQRSESETSSWRSGLAACAGSTTATASSAAASQGFHTPPAPTPSVLSLAASDDDLFDASALPVCRDDSINSLSMQRVPDSSCGALSPVQPAAGGTALVPAGDGCLGFTLPSGLGNAGAPLQPGSARGLLQPAALAASGLVLPPSASSGFGLQRCTSMGLQLAPTAPAVAPSSAAAAAAVECQLLLPPAGALQLQSSSSFSALPPPLRPLALDGACLPATEGFLVPALMFTGEREGQQAHAASFLRPLPSLISPSLSGMPF